MVVWKLIQLIQFVCEIYHVEEIQVLIIGFLSLSCISIKNVTTQAGGVPEKRSDEQRRVSYCPLNQMAMP